MIIYLKSIDYDLWLSIENEPHRPLKVEDDIEIPKAISEYNNNDKKKKKIVLPIHKWSLYPDFEN